MMAHGEQIVSVKVRVEFEFKAWNRLQLVTCGVAVKATDLQ